MKAQVHLEV